MFLKREGAKKTLIIKILRVVSDAIQFLIFGGGELLVSFDYIQ